ncbi:outer membrane protein assembly factor BamB [Luteimonas yindakuii]|uniref:outer membrane protein assembly factor BamB n=1 Tax=Luteimonas yindakuii TaxID=2565782 RepID=UPI0011077349|nr:outer membrane protein assembly factor BamB [Luteimonas yindakuii]QCO67650.2 outer membrane protein assembly factor BamB [Luteimonas yindakuii]
MKSAKRSAALRGAILLLGAVALTGCGTIRGWFSSDDDKPNTTDPAPLVEFTSTATPERIWTAGAGKGEGRIGVRQAPAVGDGRVYAAAVRGGVRAFDLQSGAQVWHYPSDLRLSGGPGHGEGLVVVGGLDGEVVALDAATGTERWQAKVGNEVLAAPVIGQGAVIVRSNDGRVTAFDVATGERRWFWVRELPTLTVRGHGSALLGPGLVFVGNDDGTVVALSIADGRVLWEQLVGPPDGRTELERMADIDGTPVLDGTVVFATSYKRNTMAIDGPTGRPLWVSDRGGVGRLGVAPNLLAVSDPAGTVWGLDKRSGSAMWQQDGLARRDLTSAVVHGNYVVVGDYDGYLHWLQLDSGQFAARARAGRDALRGTPVVADGILVVQNVDGNLSAWRIGQ